jgi:hypothetical protein
MAKSSREQEIRPSLGCPWKLGSVAYPRALFGTIKAASYLSHMVNLRPLLACNSEQYFTFPVSDVLSETIQILVRKATLTRMSRKMRLPQTKRLVSYLWERFKHFLEAVWKIWDHLWHAIHSKTFHFQPQIDVTKIIDFIIHEHTVIRRSRSADHNS